MASDHDQRDASASQVDQEKQKDTTLPTPNTPPPPPIPSADPKLVLQARTPPPLHAVPSPSSHDLFRLTPIAALKLLSAGIEALVRVTGDIPPTPPPTSPTIPNMRGMQREKAELVRSLSEKSLARLREQAEAEARAQAPSPARSNQPIDGVHLRQTPNPSPPKNTPEPYIVIGANSQPINLQHSAITRKFFSKQPPPISIEDYLLRIHRFCPMSTAVYLATSFYIFRLAVEERAIPVTRRNCHRLLLAGLRVAMKALEDLSYPHAKIAKVGGVTEIELARLEISFCFLTGFELVIGEDTLRGHWEKLKKGHGLEGFESLLSDDDAIPTLKLDAPPKGNVTPVSG
ncbi:cyclin-domain-containing protein [Hypoxylon trugodes]|uniref:cyclin-domain-containing protein n=1 Tax=Hypoxylon trugodes TaxID=326681 RepID=UPI00219CFC9C|nr:cyclin-domain-containing protein [Hypoxylon trugodes]KAI1384415.1 cyclin-domain-containing protein [Hypoxylon trugodes]